MARPHFSLVVTVGATLLFIAQPGLVQCSETNGLARTPPMGWRNWNFFQGNINQAIMEAQMKAMTDAFLPVEGLSNTSAASLFDVGYTRAGLDDNWQLCHSGVAGNPNAAQSFHNASGWPIVNTSRFPSMAGMVTYGHSRGLKVGWYDNNCICGEASSRLSPQQVDLDVTGNVEYLKSVGFDALKADGCGPGHNMTRLADLLNATGRPVLIENCHYNKAGSGNPMPPGAPPDPKGRIFPYWKDNITGGTLVCPENTFRTSGDIRNDWGSWFGNLESLIPYLDPEHPISQPGCFAYADMLMVGVYASPSAPNAGPAASVTEWRSHFGAWCIASSPLILSFDMANATTLAAVWDFVTNVEAIRVPCVNQAWCGHPGRRAAMINESIHVWTKPVASNEFAVYVVSMERPGSPAVMVTLDLSVISASLAAHGGAAVRDIWMHKDIGATSTSTPANYTLDAPLAPHDSRFLLFTI